MGRERQDQQWEITLLVQGTPRWKSPVGLPQTIISFKVGQHLVRQCSKHQGINRVRHKQYQQEADLDRGLQC